MPTWFFSFFTLCPIKQWKLEHYFPARINIPRCKISCKRIQCCRRFTRGWMFLSRSHSSHLKQLKEIQWTFAMQPFSSPATTWQCFATRNSNLIIGCRTFKQWIRIPGACSWDKNTFDVLKIVSVPSNQTVLSAKTNYVMLSKKMCFRLFVLTQLDSRFRFFLQNPASKEVNNTATVNHRIRHDRQQLVVRLLWLQFFIKQFS